MQTYENQRFYWVSPKRYTDLIQVIQFIFYQYLIILKVFLDTLLEYRTSFVGSSNKDRFCKTIAAVAFIDT